MTRGSTGRSGRRPGSPDTRGAILAAARECFAAKGFDATTVRAVAAAAGVDAALVHHYFGTKRSLYLAAVDLPIDPGPILERILDVPDDELGASIIRHIVPIWDSEIGKAAIAAVRATIAGPTPAAMSGMFTILVGTLSARVDVPAGTGVTRGSLVATQMIGLAMARHVIGVGPIASMSVDDLAALVGPTLQRYLTGELPNG